MANGEAVYEGDGEGAVKFTEDLFDNMQQTLTKLVRTYSISNSDLQGLLDVISQLWEQLELASTRYDNLEDQKKDLEEVWNEEKEKRRHTEKRKGELESRFDEERYQWQSERQELQKERVTMETKIKHLDERNHDLLSELSTQSEKFEQDQKMRTDLVEQYKKQYEIAKTSTLKRKKKKQEAGYLDYSYANNLTPPTTSPSSRPIDAETMVVERERSLSPTPIRHESNDHLGDQPLTTPPRNKRQLPKKNTVSLRAELRHTKGGNSSLTNQQEEEFLLYMETEGKEYEIAMQEELLTSGSEVLVPTVAELEMLKKEQEDNRREMVRLQKRAEVYREEKEMLDSDNAQLMVEVELLKQVISEFKTELSLLRTERDEILESYLDQPFDVYCVTKKELHEVLKKLHHTQMEMQKQSEEKQTLEMQLCARRKKKSPWKRFANRVRTMFHHKQTNQPKKPKEKEEPMDPVISYQIPPEAPFSPKGPEDIKALDKFRISRRWLVSEKGPSPSTLPSLYCQVMLKEYHVTDQITCMCLGRVYHITEPLISKRSSLLPLAARTPNGRLCAEVWVGSNEGPTTFLEVIDVLSKRVVDYFLVRGHKIVCMESVPGSLSFRKPRMLSTNSKRNNSTTSQPKEGTKQLFEDSFKLFNEDEIADDRRSISPTWKDKRTESNLREYYKSRVRRRKGSIPEQKERRDSNEDGCKECTPNNLDLKKKDNLLLTHKANTIDCPPNSLASEIMRVEPQNGSAFVGSGSLPNDQPQGMPLLEDSHENTTEVFTDDEGDGWQTSTPMRESNQFGTREKADKEEVFVWVAPDTRCIHIFPAVGRNRNKPIKTIELPTQPSCIRYVQDKVCVGLCDSKIIVYHKETIISAGLWDMENPSYVELPKLVPENPLPVRDIKLIRKKIWVTTGSFLTLLDPDLLTSQGSKFLDANNTHPDQLLVLDDVVLASAVKGSSIFFLDPDRAEVLKKITISPTAVILDNLLQISTVNITNLIKDENNVYISTSIGKIFALPLSQFSLEGNNGDLFVRQVSYPDPADISSTSSYPPQNLGVEYPLFNYTATSLLTHREGPVQGLVHIPLPEDITVPTLSNSTVNLSSLSSGMLSASSMPSLLSDSPPLSRSGLGFVGVVHPIYRSLLVSCGKGYMDYLSDSSVFEGSTALREKNEAYQVMVWGYESDTSVPESDQ